MYQPRPAGYPFPLGDFVLTGPLGEGGSGAVYAAQWGHREVALKILHPSLVATDTERSRFFAEAQLLAQITHAGVVKVLNVGALPDGRPYLAMEKLDGETLGTRLERGPMLVGESLALFGQMVDAVEAFHSHGLVHRDLKPENVFLVDRGRYAVLLDFGIAKELDAPASTVTQDGGVRGTPAYMAPERFFGHPATQLTDIYELGVVLYTMLVGRLPWDQVADPEARLNPRMPSELGISLPGRLEQVLRQALSTRPESRPESARSFLAEIDRALSAPSSVHQTADAGGPSPRKTVDLAGPSPASAQIPRSTPALGDMNSRQPDAALDQATTVALRPAQTPRRQDAHAGPYSQPAREQYAQEQHQHAQQQYPQQQYPQQQYPQQQHAPHSQHAQQQYPQHQHAHQGGPALPPQSQSAAGHQAYSTTAQGPAQPRARPVWPWIVAAVVLLCAVAVTFVVVKGGDKKQESLEPASESATEAPTTGGQGHRAQPSQLTAKPLPEFGTQASAAAWSPQDSRAGALGVARHHPATTSLLLVLRLKTLLASEDFGELVRSVAKREDLKPLFWAGAMCKVDPLEDLDWIAVGFVPDSEDTFDITVSGDLDRRAIESCVRSLSDTPAHVWIDDRTLFFSTRAGIDAAWLADRKSGADSIANAAAKELAAIDPHASLWFHGKPGEALGDDLAQDFPASDTAHGSLSLGDEVAIDLVVRYPDAAAAKRAVELAEKELADFPQGLIGTMKVNQDGPRLRLSTRINALITQMIAHMLKEALEAPSEP